MGVYIKGMEMPTSCSECAFCGYYGNGEHMCDVIQKAVEYESAKTSRLDGCPLIPVPPHGELIDRDEMFEEFVIEGQKSTRYKIGERWELNGEEIRRVIANLPTVITAEESK